jgi:hypothetical protein
LIKFAKWLKLNRLTMSIKRGIRLPYYGDLLALDRLSWGGP